MIKIIKCLSVVATISPLVSSINNDNGYRTIVFTVVPEMVEDNQISFKMACLFNDENLNYRPNSISLFFSDKFSFSTQVAKNITQPLVIGETYKLSVTYDGNFIDLKSCHYLDNAMYEVCIKEKTEEEKGNYQGKTPANVEDGVYYDEHDEIITYEDVLSYFKHQLLQKYHHKLIPLSYIENYPNEKIYNFETENEVRNNFYYLYSSFCNIKYIINNPNGNLVDIESLNDGDKLYLFEAEDYLYAYTYNPFAVEFSESILETEDYNIASIIISNNKGGVINE